MEGVELKPGFWSQKRVFVTGHTGFKGSWLSLWLQSLDASVVGFSLPAPTQPSLFEDARVAAGMTSLLGDVRDLPTIQAAFHEHRPSVVIHMAAQSLVLPAYSDPIGTYQTNVMGTANVLEAVRFSDSVRVCIIVTTDKCYENLEIPRAYSETDPLGGHDPYSSSKACAELVTAAYRKSYFSHPESAGISSVRAGNVIGGGDWSQYRLIPDVVRAFREGQPVLLRNPGAVRPWQHVLDPLSGYLELAERMWDNRNFAEAWNFGPPATDAHSVLDVVHSAADIWGQGASWKADSSQHGHEASYLKIDCSKAESRLRWRTRWNVHRAVEETIRWYKEYCAGSDARSLVQEQIRNFQEVDLAAALAT